MPDRLSPNEEDLAAFQAGDEAAVSRLFERFGNGVYSYFLARSDNEEDSLAATVSTFSLAAGSVDETDVDPAVLLFSTARQVARERGLTFAAPKSEDDPDMRSRALSAVAGLGVRDRELMTLQAVGHLDDERLEAVMGLDDAHADDVLARTRRRVSGALGPLLVARFGTEECAALGDVVGEWDGTFSDSDRAAVSRHVASCEQCSRSRSDLLSSDAVLPALLTVAAPDVVRDGVLTAVVVRPPEPEPEPELEPEPLETTADPPDEPTERTAAVPLAGPEDRGRNDLVMLGVFVLVAVVVGLIGFLVAGRFEPLERPIPATTVPGVQPDESAPTTEPPSTTTTAARSTGSTSASSGAPVVFELSTDSIEFGGDASTARFDITNTGSSNGEATIESSSEAVMLAAGTVELGPGETMSFEVGLDRDAVEEGDIDELITISWQGGSTEVRVTGSQIDNPIIHNPQARPATVQVSGDGCDNTRTTVSARITDTSPFEPVVRWSADGGGTQETAMAGVGGDVFEAVIGPFTVAQTANARVLAIDELGNAGGASVAIEVQPCP